MGRRLLRRAAWALPTLLIVSFFVFLLMDLAPGDVAQTIAGESATKEQVAEIRHRLHLDDSLPTRYVRWVGQAVHGDLGASLTTHRSVRTEIAEALPRTVSLVVVAIVLALVLAFLLGAGPVIVSSPLLDRISGVVMAFFVSLPSFWLALVLTAAFSVDRNLLPALGYTSITTSPAEWLRHLILPAAAIAASTAGDLARQMRGALRDVMETDYVLALRAKGIGQRRIVLRHGLKNAAVPVVTVLGVRLAQLLGGTVIVERIFLINGLGSLTVDAVSAHDIPTVLGAVVVAAALVMVINLLVDASYGYFNPRLRAS